MLVSRCILIDFVHGLDSVIEWNFTILSVFLNFFYFLHDLLVDLWLIIHNCLIALFIQSEPLTLCHFVFRRICSLSLCKFRITSIIWINHPRLQRFLLLAWVDLVEINGLTQRLAKSIHHISISQTTSIDFSSAWELKFLRFLPLFERLIH